MTNMKNIQIIRQIVNNGLKDNEYLNLNHKNLSDYGLKQYLQNKQKQSQEVLKHVFFDSNKLHIESIIYIRRYYWPNLVFLELSKNNFSDRACREITRINMPHIKNLFLRGDNPISSIGMSHLAKLEAKQLYKISITCNYLNHDAIFCLSKALWMKIVFYYLSNNKLQYHELIRLVLFECEDLGKMQIGQNRVPQVKSDGMKRLLKKKFSSDCSIYH